MRNGALLEFFILLFYFVFKYNFYIISSNN